MNAFSGQRTGHGDRRRAGSAVRRPGRNAVLAKCAAINTDLLAIATAQVVAMFIVNNIARPPLSAVFTSLSVAAIVICVAAGRSRSYDLDYITKHPKRYGAAVLAAILCAATLGALAYSLDHDTTRSFVLFISSLCASAAVLGIARSGFAAYMRLQARRGAFSRTVAIFGAGRQAAQLIEHLRAQAADLKTVIGVYDDRKTRLAPLSHCVNRGDLQCLEQDVQRGSVDEVFIALPWSADRRIVECFDRLRRYRVDIYLACDLIGYRFPGIRRKVLAGTVTLQQLQVPLRAQSRILKSLEDKILAIALLLIAAPLMLAIAIAIRVDTPGPVLFRQKRSGLNGTEIDIFKFRSMYHAKAHHDEFRQAGRNDVRVTPVGKILRRTSLDELPQLFNVIAGTMSLVGPRPHPIELDRQFAPLIDGYEARVLVKPGITGWAQINGWRGETDTAVKMHNRVQHDIFYIENWSLLLDFRILALSAVRGWTGSNAY